MYIYFCIRCFVFEGATGIPREENRFVSVARIILHDHYYYQRNKDNTLRHYIILHTHAHMVSYLPYFSIYLFIPLLDCPSGCLDVPFHTLFVSSSYALIVCFRKWATVKRDNNPFVGSWSWLSSDYRFACFDKNSLFMSNNPVCFWWLRTHLFLSFSLPTSFTFTGHVKSLPPKLNLWQRGVYSWNSGYQGTKT